MCSSFSVFYLVFLLPLLLFYKCSHSILKYKSAYFSPTPKFPVSRSYAPSKLPLRQWVLRAPGPHPTRIAIKPLTQLDTGPHTVLQLHIHPGSTL